MLIVSAFEFSLRNLRLFFPFCLGFIHRCEIDRFLTLLFHGPAPDADKQQLLQLIGSFESIYWVRVSKLYVTVIDEGYV